MVGLSLAGAFASPVAAQGVPIFDARLFAVRQAILDQTAQDLALQQNGLTREEELAEIQRQQLASLEGLMDAMSLGSGDVARTVGASKEGAMTKPPPPRSMRLRTATRRPRECLATRAKGSKS
jgi:hypothetical protein